MDETLFAATLRERIINGKIAGQLPTERALMRQYGVNRYAVRRTLADLRECGLITTRWGSGSYVGTPRPSADAIKQARRQRERFLAKVAVDLDAPRPVDDTPCWIWGGAKSASGYGNAYYDGACRRAHRVSWQIFRGAIPGGADIDHLCRIRACVNPAHLEPVTRRVNARRRGLCARCGQEIAA